MRHWLETHGERCLVVFDNVADPDVIRPFLPATGKARILVTSSQRAVANLGQSVRVDVFTKEEALSLLTMRAMMTDQEGTAELTAELGYLPLAIAQAAAFINRRHISYREYLLLLRAAPVSEVLTQVKGEVYPRNLTAAVLSRSTRSENSRALLLASL